MRRVLVAAGVIVILLSILAGGGLLWFRQAALAALPLLDGEIRVAGLSAPVTVVRDAQGVPHIQASSIEDLLFAQGYVTAQDRLWQMDANRRYGRGELSEIFGDRTLKVDRRHRWLQTRQAAARAVERLSAEDRAHFEAYVRGVNAAIEAQRSRLPIEFRILRYEPRPWTLADTMIIGVNISEALSTQWDVEYAREKLSRKLSPLEMADLYPNASWRDHWPGMEITKRKGVTAARNRNDVKSAMLANALPQEFCDECRAGSNNWVVSGARTASGKPLLANDMHLNHTIPNTWYEVHLRGAGWNVAGFSFPGMPFVVAGHNERIAWGFTNLGPDVQDLFIEEFNAHGEYRTPEGWRRTQITREVIKVKGAPDVTLDVESTRHGPIVSGLFPGEQRKVALQWTIYDPQALSMVFGRLNRARNWREFRTAVSAFGGATQNIVYADIDGNIGYQAAGFMPIRRSGDGTVPVPGADGSYDWTGYVPFAQLPSVFNPPSGIIATANARVTPDGYPFLLANQWGSPYRTERINQVLGAAKKLTAEDMLKLQMDTYSAFDKLLADALTAAVERAKKPSERARQAAGLMRDWDGYVTTNAVGSTIAATARLELWEMMLRPKLGDDWDKYVWFGRNVALENILADGGARWLPKDYANYDELLMAALERALRKAPRRLEDWRWGERFPLVLNHELLSGIPIVSRWSGPGTVPQSGNGSNTVKAAGRNFGASQRATYDLSDFDRSTMNVLTGQSGQIFSPHYTDHWLAWYEGRSFTTPFSEAAVKKAAAHHLRLLPQ